MDFKDELKKATYEPSKQIIKVLEDNYHELTIEQKMDLEKLKCGLRLWELEQERKEKNGSDFKWNI